MEFFTDGSRIAMNTPLHRIGWSAVCAKGAIIAEAQAGGSNINAEIFAIRDLLTYISRYPKIMDEETEIIVTTDSLTSIQIINGYTIEPEGFDMSKVNYQAAKIIVETIEKLKTSGKNVIFNHVRGHRANIGNNFADYVATQAAKQFEVKVEESNEISLAEQFESMRKRPAFPRHEVSEPQTSFSAEEIPEGSYCES